MGVRSAEASRSSWPKRDIVVSIDCEDLMVEVYLDYRHAVCSF